MNKDIDKSTKLFYHYQPYSHSLTRTVHVKRATCDFWATVCIGPLSVCLSVQSVCDVGVLWPNGWMDQDET